MPPISEAGGLQYPEPDENAVSTVAPYVPYGTGFPQPMSYDWSRFKSDLPAVVPPAATTNGAAVASGSGSGSVNGPVPPPSLPDPSAASSLALRDSEGALTIDPSLAQNTERLHKVYQDASQIDADVDALQYSINSLIENLGLDPNAIMPLDEAGNSVPNPIAPPINEVGSGSGLPPPTTNGVLHSLALNDDTDTPSSDPASVDFDFDAFFNELSSRQPALDGSADYPDAMDTSPTSHTGLGSGIGGLGLSGHPGGVGTGLGNGRFDHPIGAIDPSGVDDAQQERLTALLEDAGSNATSPLIEKHTASGNGGGTGKKRKSDVNELPPLVSSEEVPKRKKRA